MTSTCFAHTRAVPSLQVLARRFPLRLRAFLRATRCPRGLLPQHGLRALVALAVVVSAALPAAAQWRVVTLSKDPSSSTSAWAADGKSFVGQIDLHAARWVSPVAAPVMMTPPGASASIALASSGGNSANGQQVGRATIGGQTHASLWRGFTDSWVNLHPAQVAGASSSEALATDGTRQFGYARIGTRREASAWNGTAASWVSLHPVASPAVTQSRINAASTGQQGGTAVQGGITRAALWSGTAASWVDLHPAGSSRSEVNGVAGGQQVGYCWPEGSALPRACLWTGSAASVIDLQPVWASNTVALATNGSSQVGSFTYVSGVGSGGARASGLGRPVP
jgi:hypothetical protein